MTTAGVFEEIPLLDLGRLTATGADRQELAGAFTDTCHHVGFVIVTNHGVEATLVDDVFAMMERFFALPEADKLLIDKRTSPHFRGWEPVGAESTNNRTDVREQIDIWSEWPTVEVNGNTPPYVNLHGPNQWLPASVLPRHRELSLEWMAQAGRLAEGLLGLLSLGLGLHESAVADRFGDQPMSLAKFIHYPPTPPDGAGVNAHHDAGFITVLAPGPTSGLQVQNQVGDWIDVPQVPGGLVINLGEMLQAMTGNYLVATPHRVITASERMSLAYFHGASLDTPLAPLPLDPAYAEAVAASPYHRSAGFMATKDETESGVGDMAAAVAPPTYGAQLWNYFSRSYSAQMAQYYPHE